DTFNHTGKITEFHGGKIDKRLAKDMFTKYQRDFIEKIKTSKNLKFNLNNR
ncbi:hemolysin-activating lysine-acyltransferase HlyC, partial [Escherichia coli]|nr:hemolysin-activating lysine-acyltransferase HlyC [Escherichia coli]